MQVDVDEVLAERNARYGDFKDQARLAQAIKDAMRLGKWDALGDAHKEALEMMATKMARILNGDPTWLDNWVDLAGYAQLVVKELTKTHD